MADAHEEEEEAFASTTFTEEREYDDEFTATIDKNMLRLMDKRGYTVEPVRIQGMTGEPFYGYGNREDGIVIAMVGKLKKEKCTTLVNTGYDHIIMVCSHHTQPNLTYMLQHLERVELIPRYMMRSYIFDHSTVPDYEVVPSEVAATLTHAQCTRIIETDAVCVMLGLKAGDVVLERNTDSLKGPGECYRRVFAV